VATAGVGAGTEYDQAPDVIRLRDGVFGWSERDLSPTERLRKEFAELEELHDYGPRDRFLDKLNRLVALTDPAALLVDLTEGERWAGRQVLRRKIVRWRDEIEAELSALEERYPGIGNDNVDGT
jgi:hypothetical protein